MSSLFDFESPARYAVMGNPIAHSKSPRIHSEFARQTGQHMSYSAIQVDVGGFEQAVGNFRASGGKGLNVTVPFKPEAYRYANRHSERAEQAQAVNTLVFGPMDEVFGDNTDGVGLCRDLRLNLGVAIKAARILILGAGGAVQGVLGPLFAERPSEIVLVNRTVERAYALEQRFRASGNISACAYDDLAKYGVFDIVINATSAGISGQLPPLSDSIVDNATTCYDMFYASEPTAFVRWAKERGVQRAYDGLGMLVEQAAESFFLWRKVRPDTAPVIDLLRAD